MKQNLINYYETHKCYVTEQELTDLFICRKKPLVDLYKEIFIQEEEPKREFGKYRVRMNRNDKCSFIDASGNYLKDNFGNIMEFNIANNFSEGLAFVQKESQGDYNIINENGEFQKDKKGRIVSIPSISLLFGGYFQDGYVLLYSMNGNSYYFMDKNGETIKDEFNQTLYFKKAKPFINGLAEVWVESGKQCTINKQGLMLSKDTFRMIRYIENKIDKRKDILNYINKPNTEIEYYNNYFIIKDTKLNHINLFDHKGNSILKQPLLVNKPNLEEDKFKEEFNDISILSYLSENYDINFDNVKYRSGINPFKKKYIFNVDGKEYESKFKPHRYYERYVLVSDATTYYLQDLKTNEYELVGTINEVNYFDNFITTGNKAIYVVGSFLLDISKIYNSLKYNNEVTCEIEKMLSVSYFKKIIESDESYLESLRVYETNKQLKKVNEKAKEQELTIEEKKQNLEASKRELEAAFLEYQKALIKYTKALEENNLDDMADFLKLYMISKQNDNKAQIDQHIFFKKVKDHYEIREEFLKFLPYIDLSLLNWENVKVSGVNFDNTNIHFNPQKVYKKDLSGCSFANVIWGFCSFDGVNIENADFSKSVFEPGFKEVAIKEQSDLTL